MYRITLSPGAWEIVRPDTTYKRAKLAIKKNSNMKSVRGPGANIALISCSKDAHRESLTAVPRRPTAVSQCRATRIRIETTSYRLYISESRFNRPLAQPNSRHVGSKLELERNACWPAHESFTRARKGDSHWYSRYSSIFDIHALPVLPP